ncbi:MAG: nuclear transport factor 2 family protein [Pseudomonas sp.]|uniref:nuclear transport factor 2 family protein n=1 Tax=Pseudomonas sp. TaxID=306 RepID=UPI00339142AC
MPLSPSPEDVVQCQLEAYNARDLQAWVATYADTAQQFEYPGRLLASGRAQITECATSRFQESNLHARLLQRTVMGAMVVDHEEVTRTFPEGPGWIELLAIYEVRDGKIQSATFAFGERRLASMAP